MSRCRACIQADFLKRFRDPIWVPSISNRIPRIRQIGSLQIHTGYLTFSLKKPWYKCWLTCNINDATMSSTKKLLLAYIFAILSGMCCTVHWRVTGTNFNVHKEFFIRCSIRHCLRILSIGWHTLKFQQFIYLNRSYSWCTKRSNMNTPVPSTSIFYSYAVVHTTLLEL